VILKNLMTDEFWFWSKDTIKSYGWQNNFFYELLVRILGVLEIILALFLVSNTTAIYIKMTIICAPIFILIISNSSLISSLISFFIISQRNAA